MSLETDIKALTKAVQELTRVMDTPAAPAPVAAAPAPVAAPSPIAEEWTAQAVNDQLRAIAFGLGEPGPDKVRGMLATTFSAAKLSEVPSNRYAELVQAARALV